MDDISTMLELATWERTEVQVMGDFNCIILSPNFLTHKLTTIMLSYQLISTPRCV